MFTGREGQLHWRSIAGFHSDPIHMCYTMFMLCLQGERVSYTGDPLQDFTLIRFICVIQCSCYVYRERGSATLAIHCRISLWSDSYVLYNVHVMFTGREGQLHWRSTAGFHSDPIHMCYTMFMLCLQGERVSYTGDPLQDFTLIRFICVIQCSCYVYRERGSATLAIHCRISLWSDSYVLYNVHVMFTGREGQLHWRSIAGFHSDPIPRQICFPLHMRNAMLMLCLQGERVSYTGDPLQDFTLIRFLDRFVFKNPKKKEACKLRTRNVQNLRDCLQDKILFTGKILPF